MPMIDLEVGLSDEEVAIRDTVHKFAEEELRPAGQQLDRLSPEDVIARDSILWKVFAKYRQLGLNEIGTDPDNDLSSEAQVRLRYMISEELGWGDAGLAISLGVSNFPAMVAQMSGNPELIEKFPRDQVGCWAITEPDHGSDMVDFGGKVNAKDRGRPNCLVRRDGDDLILNGQKAAWVSNGTIAQAAALFSAIESDNGEPASGVFLVPLDAPGVSKGKPLDKIGQRALNQGEIFFDDVRLPANHMVIGPELYPFAADGVLCQANGGMGSIFVGLARAALEMALDYAKERVQGGVPIIEHQSVKARLFTMFRKVEAARSLNRRVVMYNSMNSPPALHYAIASKVTSTQTAFEVASDALGIFGGNGLTREYPIEKLLRDARASMIEDGCNEVLSLLGAERL